MPASLVLSRPAFISVKKFALLAIVATALASSAMAQTTPVDPTATALANFPTAVTTAVTIVGGLVTLGAGIAVYKKVKGFFSKAG